MNGALTKSELSSKAIYIHSSEANAAEKLGLEIHRLGTLHSYSEIVILCIGTDRATGDSLGPLTGYLLSRALNIQGEGVLLARQGGGRAAKSSRKIKLYGTLEAPVHAKNLQKTINIIHNQYKNPFIIAIDACLGKTKNVGCLTIGKGSVNPGAGIGKELPLVGDIFVTGIVNFSGVMELQVLQNTRLNVVMKMAEVISEGVQFGINMLHYSETTATL